MSDVFIPFNHQPISTQNGNWTTTYTCPAGKYARVRVQCSGRAVGSPGLSGSATGGDVSTSTSDSFAMSFEIWVTAGDTVSGAIVSANSTTGAVNRGTTSSTSSVEVYKNAATIANLFCSAVATHAVAVGTPASTVTGSASFYWVAEEYSILT